MSEENVYCNVPPRTRRSKGFQVEAPQRRSKVTVERVALVVLSVLLLAAVSAVVGVLSVNRSCRINRAAKEETTNTSSSEPVPTCPTSVARCGEDWELHGTKCYYFSPLLAELPWKGSRVICQQLKADLVKIESREEQEYLGSKLGTLMVREEDKFWIGLTDRESEGQWVWTDGSPLDPSLAFWTNQEPDNWTKEDPEGEDCVRIGRKPMTEGLNFWYDQSCKRKQRSICEKKAKII